MSYEFSDDEAQVISGVGLKAIIIAFLFILGGIVDLFIVIRETDDQSLAISVGFILLTVLQIIIGLVLLIPSNSFKLVATTKGRDIEEMMTGLDKLSNSFAIISMLAIISFFINFLLFFYSS